MGLSGSKPARNKITPRDKAILEVKVQRDRLKQYQKKLTVITERETEIAKEHLKNGNKPLALLALKKRTYQTGLLTQTHTQLFTLEQLVQAIEFAQVEVRVVEGLKAGNRILRELQEEVRVDDVEKLMDDTAEAIAYQNELSQLISGNQNVHIDEDELLEELEALKLAEHEQEHLDDGLVRVDGEIIKLPSVPSTKVVVVVNEADEAIEAESTTLAATSATAARVPVLE